jgi:hypothetical protein
MTRQKKSSEKIAVLQKSYWRASDAQEILDLWRRSGMSMTAYARSHGFQCGRLARWQKRLSAPEHKVPRFHRVRVVPTSAAPESGEHGVEIRVVGGRRVTVRPGFDGALLADVIRVLESLSC